MIAAIFIWNAEVRKGSLKTIQPHYSATFFTELPPYRTFKAIMEFASRSGYRIDDFDEQKLEVILNERMSLTSYGSLYPIYVREQGGRTVVEVGVTSKLGKVFLISPINKKLVTLRLDRVNNRVRSLILTY